MRILRATAHNFLSFQELDFEYSQAGLTLIEGPTGVGKSSFLDVISYGLFGQISKDVNVEEIINRKAGRNLYVRVEVEYLGKHYAVVRCRKHNELGNDVWLEVDGTQNRGKNALETDKLIQSTLNLNFEIFQKATYFSQFSRVDAFLASSDTDKKRLISDIGGLNKYDQLLEKAKKLVTSLDSSIVLSRSQLKSASDSTAMLTQMKDEMLKKRSDWETRHAYEISILEQGIVTFAKELEKKIEDERIKKATFETQRSQRISALSVEKTQFESERNKKIESVKSSIAEDLAKIESQEKTLIQFPNEPARDFNGERAQVRQKLDLIKQLKSKKAELAGKLSFHRSNLDQKKGKADVELKKISDGSPSHCNFCHQQISQELIISQVKLIQETFLEDNVAIEQLQNNIATIDQGIQQETALESELQKINTEENQYRFDVAKNDQTRNYIQQIRGSISSKEKEIVHHQTCANPVQAKIDLEMAAQNPSEKEIDKLMGMTNPHLQTLEILKSQTNPYSSELSNLEEKVRESTVKHEAVKLEAEGFEKRHRFAVWWKDALGVYIRSYLMDSFIDQINSKSNEYLETLFDGLLQIEISSVTEAGKDLKEKISVKIFNSGDECSYDSLSGGERCRVCLAVNLAISDLACSVNQSSFNILMMDEMFNGLDENGKNQTVKLLKDLEGRFDTVFVIDHTESFKSMFTNTINVEKMNGVSRLGEVVVSTQS